MTESAGVTPSSTVVRVEQLSADLGGEIVLMRVDTGRYYGFDEVGSDIWRRMEAPIRVDALCAALETRYDAAPDVIARDVKVLLDELASQGLIEVQG